jgi:hypothetical protein
MLRSRNVPFHTIRSEMKFLLPSPVTAMVLEDWFRFLKAPAKIKAVQTTARAMIRVLR